MTTKEKITYLLKDNKVLTNETMEDPEIILCYTGKIDRIISTGSSYSLSSSGLAWDIKINLKENKKVSYPYPYHSPAFLGIILSLQAINGEIGEVKIETNYKNGTSAVNVYHEGELINYKALPDIILKEIASNKNRRVTYLEDIVQELNNKLFKLIQN